jgi:hypothetical protein
MTYPDAIKLLTEKVNETSQARVAEKLGYSPAAINTVLKGTCPNPEHILQRVIEVFGGLSVACPELRGDITLAECAGHRKREPVSDSFYARMYRACQKCTRRA